MMFTGLIIGVIIGIGLALIILEVCGYKHFFTTKPKKHHMCWCHLPNVNCPMHGRQDDK